MKTKNLLLFTAVAIATSATFTSCTKDDEAPAPTDPVVTNPPAATTETLSGTITSNKTLSKNKIYFLDGRVIIPSGVELTINAGTIIKGNPGQGTNAAALIIARGAKIHANGTASEPIIFTSSEDNIASGQIVSPNLSAELDGGKWGGLIILGDAPISPSSGTTEQIEGIPASVSEGNYGGNNASDNSGELTYVSIRHGGITIGNEINGLTLGGVGSGTTINHVEVVGNNDDGIEFFGGTVNASDLLVMYQSDDAFDVDQAYAGTISNIAYIAGAGSDHALEIDGPEGSSNATGKFTITGGKLQGNTNATNGEYADFRSGAQGNVQDLYFFDFATGKDIELDDDATSANRNNGDLTFTGLVFNSTDAITDISADKAAVTSGDFDAYFSANNSIGTSPSAGNTFNKGAFTGWTWADSASLLTNF